MNLPTGDEFRALIWGFFEKNARDMPWRRDHSPYRVFVSEVMLQQTQVSRVTAKFPPFVERFPDFSVLADAPFSEVVREWSGLGYNRRARYLHDAAQTIARRWGVLPDNPAELVALPGIGANTAGSIAAFAYNKPTVFIETNIRRVYLHHFFPDRERVPDRPILHLIETHLDRDRPREWYWALMDYGTTLRRSGNANTRSRHYTRQSQFERSDRQLRGRILRLLSEHEMIAAERIPEYTGFPRERVDRVVEALVRERMLERVDDDDRSPIRLAD